MSRWREIKFYAHGTPTKTTKRLRRRHLFDLSWKGSLGFGYFSPCGLKVIGVQMSEGPTDSPKCGNCLKAIRARKRKRK